MPSAQLLSSRTGGSRTPTIGNCGRVWHRAGRSLLDARGTRRSVAFGHARSFKVRRCRCCTHRWPTGRSSGPRLPLNAFLRGPSQRRQRGIPHWREFDLTSSNATGPTPLVAERHT